MALSPCPPQTQLSQPIPPPRTPALTPTTNTTISAANRPSPSPPFTVSTPKGPGTPTLSCGVSPLVSHPCPLPHRLAAPAARGPSAPQKGQDGTVPCQRCHTTGCLSVRPARGRVRGHPDMTSMSRSAGPPVLRLIHLLLLLLRALLQRNRGPPAPLPITPHPWHPPAHGTHRPWLHQHRWAAPEGCGEPGTGAGVGTALGTPAGMERPPRARERDGETPGRGTWMGTALGTGTEVKRPQGWEKGMERSQRLGQGWGQQQGWRDLEDGNRDGETPGM